MERPAMKSAPQRIALVKLGAMGDCVNSLPFVNRLRAGFPQAEIIWVIGREAHSLLRDHPAVDRFVVVDKSKPLSWRAPAAALRKEGVDLAIDLQRILKSGLLVRALTPKRRLGFDRARSKEWSWLFTNERIAANSQPGVTVAQYLEFADYLGLPPQEPTWNLDIGQAPETAAHDGPRIILNLGASKPANLWPAEYWHELSRRLIEDSGAHIELSGGPQDRELAERVARGLPQESLENHVGALSWKDTAALLARADLFVGGDTGPLHVAVAVGTPVVALFGAADPDRTGPFGQAAWVLSRPVPCSPCRRKSCNVAGHPCMTGLSPADVFEAIARRLQDSAKST